MECFSSDFMTSVSLSSNYCNGVLHVLQDLGSGLQRCRGEKSFQLDFDFLEWFRDGDFDAVVLEIVWHPEFEIQCLATSCNILQHFATIFIFGRWGFSGLLSSFLASVSRYCSGFAIWRPRMSSTTWDLFPLIQRVGPVLHRTHLFDEAG